MGIEIRPFASQRGRAVVASVIRLIQLTEHEALFLPLVQPAPRLDSGGMVDIAFVVQYLALAQARGLLTLVEWSAGGCPLPRLGQHPLISAGAVKALA